MFYTHFQPAYYISQASLVAQDKESTCNEAYAGMIPVSMRLQRVQHDLVTMNHTLYLLTNSSLLHLIYIYIYKLQHHW